MPETKSEEAVRYVTDHCKYMGSFAGDFAPFGFLLGVAKDIAVAPNTPLFPERYKEHVAYAVEMVARHAFLEPPSAVSAVYLATRFEFFFRLLSGKLNRDGTWINKAKDQPAAIGALGKRGFGGNRVCDVALTYKLMKLDQTIPVARLFAVLDNAILPNPITAVGCFPVTDIGDRIAFGRHSAGHGHWGDISSEAIFYGLITAIVFYNQT